MSSKKKAILAVTIVLSTLLLVSAVLTQTTSISGLPRVDEIWYKAYPGAEPEVIVDEFLAGVTDWMRGPSRSDLHESVIGAGHKISTMQPNDGYTFFPINCRPYKETSGEPNMPLNDSAFRIALSYIYGVDDKQEDIFGYYGVPWLYAIPTPIPECYPYYIDPSVVMPNTDYPTAWNVLQEAGYTVDGDGWLAKDGEKIRDGGTITLHYSTGSLVYPQGPGGGMVRNYNAFLTYIGAVGPTMEILPTDFSTLVSELMSIHNFDIIGIGISMGSRYCDWIYDLSHSSCDQPWYWNFAGIHDADFDAWADTILTDMVLENVRDACFQWQAKFVYEVMPWFPVIGGLIFDTTARDDRGELMNLVSMPLFGSSDPMHSWMSMHWRGTPGEAWPGGLIKKVLGDEVHSMSPYTEDTTYGWDILDRQEQDLLELDPETLENIPFLAVSYETEPWTSIPELGIDEGMTTTFMIRQDVTWQDGRPVTAYDCVTNMRAMREWEIGRYASSWNKLVYEEADGPYKFNCYFYTTSLYFSDNVAGIALKVPGHIIEALEQQIADGILANINDWNPAETSYEDLMGEAPPEDYPFMKQIVGCGPFVFDEYDRSLATGHVVKYNDYWINAPAIGAVVGEWRIDPDTAYEYSALVQNLGAVEDSEEGEVVPVTVDVKIYEDDVPAHEETGITINPWKYTYLGQYTTGNLAAGPHTITVEVYMDGELIHTYEHTFVATKRQDINTYTGTTLDFKIDIMDIARAAKAFGSSPGHPRWDPPADVNDDFKVNIMDIAGIAKQFGWSM